VDQVVAACYTKNEGASFCGQSSTPPPLLPLESESRVNLSIFGQWRSDAKKLSLRALLSPRGVGLKRCKVITSSLGSGMLDAVIALDQFATKIGERGTTATVTANLSFDHIPVKYLVSFLYKIPCALVGHVDGAAGCGDRSMKGNRFEQGGLARAANEIGYFSAF
jgi:hypothetical protein